MAPVKRGRKPNEKVSVKLQPLTEVPNPPDHLGEIAQQYWRTIAPQLVEANILTALHLESFAILCETYQEYRALSAWLQVDYPERMTFKSKDSGYEQESPQVRMRDRANANLQKLWLKFGLTPMALAQMRKHGGLGSRQKSKIEEFADKKGRQSSDD